MIKKILVSMLLFALLITPSVVNAGLLDNIMKQGTNFVRNSTSESIGSSIAYIVRYDIMPVVFSIGTLIFAAITVILGVKFIWSSAEGKSEVQEALPGFVIAVVFFYLAEPLVNFLLGSTSTVTGISNTNDLNWVNQGGAVTWSELAGRVIIVINYIVKYLALAGLIYLGVRYMIASAEGKASMKTNMGGAVIGIIFVFLASNVVQFFINTGDEIL